LDFVVAAATLLLLLLFVFVPLVFVLLLPPPVVVRSAIMFCFVYLLRSDCCSLDQQQSVVSLPLFCSVVGH